MDNLDTRFQHTKGRISQALAAAKRDDSVHLLAVSKYHSVDKIKALYALGQTEFGENYVSEAQDKIVALADYAICWHFIGPIQSNKTRQIASLFDWVQSVDRIKIAQRLSQQRPENKEPLNICLQLNLNNEAQKSGFSLAELEHNIAQISDYPNLRIRGLMAIPEQSSDLDQQRHNFAQLRQLQEKMSRQFNLNLDTLSMGMSSDLEAAILEGSNMVRIGTALFGSRD